MFRFLTAGESHGQSLCGIIDGFPAGVEIDIELVNRDLARRQMGYGRGDRMKIEKDKADIIAGVRGGRTLASPIAFLVRNDDWVNWDRVMNPAVNDPAAIAEKQVHNPRPGHADLTGVLKYGHDDVRNVLERASARETTTRVAVGAFAKAFLAAFDIKVTSHVIAFGGIEADPWTPDSGIDPRDVSDLADKSEVRCLSEDGGRRMIERIEKAMRDKDTLGGIFEVIVSGVPPGLGSYTQWDKRLDARLVRALVSIPAVKGAEVGSAVANSAKPGREVHDEIFKRGPGEEVPGRPNHVGPFYRKTNRAGGTEGGMSNAEPLILHAFKKPIPTVMQPLSTVDISTGEPVKASTERSDVATVPAASVVGEAVVAIEIAGAFMEAFGGSTLVDIRNNYRNYLERIG